MFYKRFKNLQEMLRIKKYRMTAKEASCNSLNIMEKLRRGVANDKFFINILYHF